MRSAPRLALVATALLALGACERAAGPAAKAPEAKPAAAPASADGSWLFGAGKNSVELIHLPAGGAPEDADLHMICARGAGFLARLPGLKPVASEERLSIGAGDEVVALVATPDGQGVKAAGVIDEALLKGLDGGGPIAVNHGAQTAGPFASPPEAVRRAFTQTCRKLRAGNEI